MNTDNKQEPQFARVYEREYRDCLQIMVIFHGSPTDEEASNYLVQINTIYQRKREFTILYDATNIGRIKRKFFHQQIQSMRTHDEDTRLRMKRCVIIVRDRSMEFLLNTIFKIKPSACQDLKTFYQHTVAAAWWYLFSGESKTDIDQTLLATIKSGTQWKIVVPHQDKK